MEILIFSLLLILALIGVPLFVILSGFGITAFYFAETPLESFIVEIYRIASAPTLITIPLFTFAGYLMAESNSPKRLLRVAEVALGWMPGGIAIVGLVVCAFFTAFTGASGVTIIALGGLIYPILTKEGYSKDFSLGLITSSGSLGLLFPPSLPIILYGLVAKVDIDKLFLAGLVPGVLLIFILSIYSIAKRPVSEKKFVVKFSCDELIKSVKEASWELILPFAVLYGIYGGLTTVTEAAALTAVYVLFIETVVYKDINIKTDLAKIVFQSMSLVGAILLILCCALGLTNFLVDEEVPMKILGYVKQLITNKYVFLAFLNIFLLIVGAMMDIFSAIIVVVPLIVPIAKQFGIDPIHLAIIFLTNLEIGYLTPPIGINLFISSFRFGEPVTKLYKSSFPFLIFLLLALILITYVPSLSLFWFN